MNNIFDFANVLRARCGLGYRNPMTASSPPEPSLRAQLDQEGAEFMAGEEFDDASKDALEYVLDDPDLIEPILQAAIYADIYPGAPMQNALKAAIDKARQDYIAFKTGR